VIYPSKDYRERLEKLHREKVKIIVIEEVRAQVCTLIKLFAADIVPATA